MVLKKKKFINKVLFQKKLKINFIKDKKIFITTFHPDTTISVKDNIKNLLILIDFLKQLNENIVFTYPNADYGYKKYIKIINKLKKYKNFFIIKNLGQEMFFSALNFSNLLIGNSSSGVIEAPSFKIPVMNLGNRQKNRFTSNVVINSNFNIAEMKRKFRLLNSSSHKLKIKRSLNIYENNNAVKKAAKIIYQL